MIECSFIETYNPSGLSRPFQRTILTWKHGQKVSSDDISISPSGKPELKGYRNIHFNTSHTRGGMICAVGSHKLGVDIEYLRRARYSLANRYFHEQEIQFVFHQSEGIDLRFIQVWTRKEAYIKALGQDLSYLGDSYNVLKLKGMLTFSHRTFIVSVYVPGIEVLTCLLDEIQYDPVQACFQKIKSTVPIFPSKMISSSHNVHESKYIA